MGIEPPVKMRKCIAQPRRRRHGRIFLIPTARLLRKLRKLPDEIVNPFIHFSQGFGKRIRIVVVGPGGSNTTVWDSGTVRSPRQAFVPYGGPTLEADARYRWTVSTADADGHWSKPSTTSFAAPEMAEIASGSLQGRAITPRVLSAR